MTKVMLLVRTAVFVAGMTCAAGYLTPVTVLAQEAFGQNWKDMSPDAREQLRQQYFSNLPESQQQRLRKNQQKFQALPGNQKRTLCQKFLSQNGYLPPTCQTLLGP